MVKKGYSISTFTNKVYYGWADPTAVYREDDELVIDVIVVAEAKASWSRDNKLTIGEEQPCEEYETTFLTSNWSFVEDEDNYTMRASLSSAPEV